MPEAAEKLLKPDLKLTPEQIAEFVQLKKLSL